MLSISLRWLSEKLSAEAAGGIAPSARANRAGRSRRSGGIANPLRVSPQGEFLAGPVLKNAFGDASFEPFGSVNFELFFWPGGSFAAMMSSALTQPGVPTAKRVLAREARSRAVLLSPRRKAACAD